MMAANYRHIGGHEGSRERLARRVSWLGPPATRCCIALRTGNSLPDRSNITRSSWPKAGCSRSSRNPDNSPTWIIIIRPRQARTSQPPAVASVVPAMVPVPPVPAGKAAVQAREAAVVPAAKSRQPWKPPPWKPPPPPPPCAAWARSGWQRTAAPSNAAAMLTKRRLFLGRAPLLRNSCINDSIIVLSRARDSYDPAGFMCGYVLLMPAAPITLGKFW